MLQPEEFPVALGSNIVKLTEKFTNVAAPSQQEIPQAEASVQQTEEHASTADDNQAAEDNVSSKADDCIPATEEIARAPTSGVPEESEELTLSSAA